MILPAIPWKKIVILSIGTAVAFFILFRSVASIGQLTDILRHTNGIFILFAVFVILPTPLLSGLRWYAVLRATGHSISFWRITRITTASMAFLAIPGRLGDFIRINPLRHEIRATRTIATIIVEKMMDIAVLWWFAAIGFLALEKSLPAIGAGVAGFFVLGIIIFGGRLARMVPVGKISEKLVVVGQAFHDVRTQPRWLLVALMASALNWSISLFSTWFVFQALGNVIPLDGLFAYLPLVIFAGLIPFGIAGTGTRDGAFLLAFTQYAPAATVLAGSVAYTALGYLLFTVIGIPFLKYLRNTPSPSL